MAKKTKMEGKTYYAKWQVKIYGRAKCGSKYHKRKRPGEVTRKYFLRIPGVTSIRPYLSRPICFGLLK